MPSRPTVLTWDALGTWTTSTAPARHPWYMKANRPDKQWGATFVPGQPGTPDRWEHSLTGWNESPRA